jgi:LysR family transcriptional regulator, chromosome initiation inhibitor
MRLLSANLKAFLSIARLGTVHGAAKDLHLTQTGVTQRIRALEAELETTLFLRSRKGMLLTSEGEALLRYCRGAEDLEGQALSQIYKSGREHAIYLAITGPTSIMNTRIANQMIPIFLENANMFLNFIVSDLDERLQLVRSGVATFAIVPPELVPNEMDSKLLKPDKYVLVGSPKWKGRRLADILNREKIIDFNESDQTTLNYLKRFELISKVGQPRLFVNGNDALIKLFSAGVGFGTLTQDVVRPFIEAGELILLNNGAMIEEPHALAWYPRPQVPYYFKSIVQAIK